MGTSYRYFKEEVGEYLKKRYGIEESVLDVGAGEGTYYELLKDHFKNMECVEVFMPNIERYGLEDKYKRVYCTNIKDFKYEYYDLVIFGDVLEHLEVEEAQEVLKYAIEHSRGVLVAVPYMYVQGAICGNKYEEHKQDDLTKENVLERYPSLELLIGNEEYGYYVKKGEKKNEIQDK